MNLRVRTDGDRLRQAKVLPAFDGRILAARVEHLPDRRHIIRQISMMHGKEPLAIPLVSIEGNVSPLVSAPRLLYGRHNDALLLLLKAPAICEHGIILVPVILIPRKVALRRKK